jgi:dTDP-glucose 4,6-dehydratase
MSAFERNVLITGGAGFIGSHAVRLFVNNYPNYRIYNLDKLTYAGNLSNLSDIEGAPNYEFIKADIVDSRTIDQFFVKKDIDAVIHLAAESHVDRSISDPMAFIDSNIVGTVNLLNSARKHWSEKEGKIFYHVSTDEVYGSSKEGFFSETTPYDPQSPYSASKASSDHFVKAYGNTYGLPIILSNCSNNYGPNQFPEKLIPLCINNIKNIKPLPVYGKGNNVRDWLYVEDHVKAIDTIFHNGQIGETYNIGGLNEWENIKVVRFLCQIMDAKLGRSKGESEKLITFVKDRAGHDLRYAIDASKLASQLDWKPEVTFEVGLEQTVDWYLENEKWLENVISGDYQNYYQQQYG